MKLRIHVEPARGELLARTLAEGTGTSKARDRSAIDVRDVGLRRHSRNRRSIERCSTRDRAADRKIGRVLAYQLNLYGSHGETKILRPELAFAESHLANRDDTISTSLPVVERHVRIYIQALLVSIELRAARENSRAGRIDIGEHPLDQASVQVRESEVGVLQREVFTDRDAEVTAEPRVLERDVGISRDVDARVGDPVHGEIERARSTLRSSRIN